MVRQSRSGYPASSILKVTSFGNKIVKVTDPVVLFIVLCKVIKLLRL